MCVSYINALSLILTGLWVYINVLFKVGPTGVTSLMRTDDSCVTKRETTTVSACREEVTKESVGKTINELKGGPD